MVSFSEVILKFTGDVKFPDYKEIVEEILTCFQAFVCSHEFESSFLCVHT